MAVLLYVITCLVVFIVYQLSKAWRANQHWKNLGVAHKKPILIFGNMFDLVTRRRTQQEIIRDLYEAFPNEKVIGYYHFTSPRILIRDQNLVERVLVQDFTHFGDRIAGFSVKGNPLLLNLFALTGNHWRAMRAKLSPMFTTGKLRQMVPQINRIADDLVPILDHTSTNVDVKEETSKFAMEVISSCAFGVDPGALDSQSEFNAEAKIAFASSFWILMKRLLLFAFPKIASFFKIGFMTKRTERYFGQIIKTAINHRRETKATRNDFVQQMVTLLDKGFIEIEKHDPGDDYLTIKDEGENNFKLELNTDVMVGQSFVFLLAGFETVSTTMTFMCLDLALHPEAQEKARKEVNEIWSSGELTFDKIKEMKYLDGCLKETLRLRPPIGHLVRCCTKTYDIPGTSVTIKPGEMVVLSVLGVQGNPDIYPQPEKYSPDRWESHSHPPCTFLPFGDGPRICIGMRFATMEAKCCIAKILKHYTMSPHPSMELPIKIDPYSFFGNPLKPVLLQFQKL